MTTYLLHVTINEVIQRLTDILLSRNYEINYQNPDQTMVVAYTTNDLLRMVQINLRNVNSYLEINIHSTSFCKGTSLLINDSKEEEFLCNELDSGFSNDNNTFRLTPEDYVFSFI